MIFDDTIIERQQGSNMPNQQLDAADDFQRGPNEDAFDQYKEGGYTYLQNIIANEILLAETGNAGSYISMVYSGMKTNEYIKDEFAEAADSLWGYSMLIIFIAPMYRFLFNSVLEKEMKIREAMKIMGLTDLPYWLSWFAYYLLINTIQSLLMMFILVPVFEFTNIFLVFLYLWLYGMSLFGY
jgi:ATP-binding cassette, subfamily A (ABC1), member 3